MDELEVLPRPSGRLSPGSRSPSNRRRRISLMKREKQDFFRKYNPLSSTHDLLGNSIKDHEKSFVLDPTGKQAYHWLIAVAVTITYFMWSIPLRVAFDSVYENVTWVWMILDAVAYGVYITDIFLQARTSYLRDGILERDLKKIKLSYTESKYFKFDLLSSLPLDWGYFLLFRTPAPLLQCIKLLKIYRVKQFHTRTESRSHYPNRCRVLFLLHNLLVIIHWNACCYYLLSKWIGVGSDPWVYPAWNATHNNEWGDFTRQYIYSFYWSTLTLTTIGELPEPHTNLEYIYMIFEYLTGILMFASLVGNVGSIIDNMQKSKIKFQNKMDNIKKYMKTTEVPTNLQEKVIKWFDYLWSYGHPVDERHALDALPDKLKAEIGIHVHFETLKKVDFFEECDQGLLWEIVVRLRSQVYSPGEYVCRKGDVGREMYIVNSGKLEVLVEENGEVLKELVHGEYFGEISILSMGLGKSHSRRTAFVRSLGYTSLLCLTQGDLLDILKDYPNTKDMLISKSKRKLECDTYDNEIEINIEQSTSTTFPLEDEGYSQCGTPDSSDLMEDMLPLKLSTVADQIIDLSDKLVRLEDLMNLVLVEVMKNSKNSKTKNVNEQPSTFHKIQQRVRKISSIM